MIRNAHFYNRNETRWYPLSDAANPVNQNGQLLPSAILADLNLRYPSQLGTYPFLASVCVTPTLVSITIQAAASLTDTTCFAPVAVFSLPQPVTPFIQYPLAGQVPGAGGWVVFGEGILEPYAGKFAGPRAGLLSPRAARAFRPLPVASLGLAGMPPLSGLVLLKAEEPVRISRQSLEIDGVLRDAIVFDLVQPLGDASQASILQTLTGPCGARPESGTCPDPQPLETLNAAAPDCAGNLNIQFTGGAVIRAVMESSGVHGVVVDYPLGLAAACLPAALPDANGNLGKGADQCAAEHSESAVVFSPPGPTTSPGDSESVPHGALPYSENFNETDSEAENWVTASGRWIYTEHDSPDDAHPRSSYSTEDGPGPAQRNIALWEGFDTDPLGRTYTASVQMLPGPVNSLHNAGLVLNYQPDPAIPGGNSFFLVQLDYDAQQLEILRFAGNAFISAASVDVPGLALNNWYKLVVSITPGAGTVVNITALLSQLSGSGGLSSSLSAAVGNYLPATGYCGLHANRAASRFGYFHVTG